MFLWAYFAFLFWAILLWFVIIRVTKDEEGLDWWDAGRWLAGAYLVGFAMRGLGYLLHLPEAITLVLEIITGLTVLDVILKGQFGREKAFEIVAIFAGIRLLFVMPWIIMWYVSKTGM